MRNFFESGRGWLNEATNDPWFADFAQLQGIEMDGKDFEPNIKPLLEKALEEGTWVLLAGHEIGAEGTQTTRTKMLEQLMAYVKEVHPEIWLAPVGEIAAYVRQQRKINHQNIIKDLTFYSSFDQGTDADFGKGDLGLYTANSYDKPDDARSGIQVADIYLGSDQGRFGTGLVFKRKTKESLYYRAKENVNYKVKEMAGTISFWLSLNPEEDLEPGYCDPIQITDVGYNDAAFWVDFSNKNPRLFRMGVFGDLNIWNPTNISPDVNPDFNNRLIVAKDRPFGHDVWTHIAIVYSQLNTQSPGKATFYVNGLLQGEREIPESFTWDLDKAKIFLGLNYVGRMDDLAIFTRALNQQELNAIYQLEGGISSLLEDD
ncbi:MAG: hypothetical protein IPL46_00135 [Saprospiraceae bacterium]|nr:hypothetical protein [Saprospiraceae bacterium]